MMGKKLLHDQAGASAIEYAVIMALIAVTLVGALSSLGTETSNSYSAAAAGMESSAAAAPEPEPTQEAPPPRIPSQDRGNRVRP
tara:strand:- start:478 stop:729 length:252 start_codon:yes stop_codon:yes gene_type:complete